MIAVAGITAVLSVALTDTVATARTVTMTEVAQLHLVRRSGSVLYERGTVSGTLDGTVSARFETSTTSVSGRVTIYPHGGGSLTINVAGNLESLSGVNATFTGSIAVRRGTGRYARATGSGTFTGIVNRRTWAAKVTARGRLTY
ncbi:outer membrane autotransporter [Conexibacter woesei DSM 14684]|uniref:Outer membrane autotransporter n=2 Tax=Conexibacter TaxID=191494 RepID=D3F3A2_CONWI|nr:outer membrane autotransporter [Conexibacter woesei DSM 14684]